MIDQFCLTPKSCHFGLMTTNEGSTGYMKTYSFKPGYLCGKELRASKSSSLDLRSLEHLVTELV